MGGLIFLANLWAYSLALQLAGLNNQAAGVGFTSFWSFIWSAWALPSTLIFVVGLIISFYLIFKEGIDRFLFIKK